MTNADEPASARFSPAASDEACDDCGEPLGDDGVPDVELCRPCFDKEARKIQARLDGARAARAARAEQLNRGIANHLAASVPR